MSNVKKKEIEAWAEPSSQTKNIPLNHRIKTKNSTQPYIALYGLINLFSLQRQSVFYHAVIPNSFAIFCM